jgi:hypothetical protein
MPMKEFDLVRDILDKQLIDSEEEEMGRVDGIVIEIRKDQPPRIDHLELGFTVLAERIHPRVERWLHALRERWSVRRSARQLVPWSAVIEVDRHHLKLNVKAEETPAFDWERWLRKHIVSKLSGGEEDE